jgi:hypothetical protein
MEMNTHDLSFCVQTDVLRGGMTSIGQSDESLEVVCLGLACVASIGLTIFHEVVVKFQRTLVREGPVILMM